MKRFLMSGLLLLGSMVPLLAQSGPLGKGAGLRPVSDVETLVMPLIYNEQLLERDAARTEPGPMQFAEPIEVDLHPGNSGVWERGKQGEAVWRLRIRSEGAKSINLGFTSYQMPQGGKLFVHSPDYYYVQG